MHPHLIESIACPIDYLHFIGTVLSETADIMLFIRLRGKTCHKVYIVGIPKSVFIGDDIFINPGDIPSD